MAGKACHVFASTPQRGLTQALGTTPTMSKSFNSILLVLPFLLSGCAPTGMTTQVIEATGVFGTEEEAATAGSINRPAPKPLAMLAAGDSVAVVSDTYGKDYWACKVRTQESVSGWVLCTSLDYQRGSGA